MTLYQQVKQTLQASGFHYTLHEHTPIRTVQDVREKIPQFFLPTRLLKTVAFRVKDGAYVLVALLAPDRVDYRHVAQAVGVNRRQLRSLSPEAVEAELGAEVGGVGPIYPLNQPHVLSFIDEKVRQTAETVFCGSGRNDITIEIQAHDLIQVSGATLITASK